MAKINLEQLTIRIEGELKKVANVLKKVELKEYSFTYTDENGQTQTKKSTLLENIKYLVEQLLALKKVAEGKQDELTLNQLTVLDGVKVSQLDKNNWDAKQTALSQAQLDVINALPFTQEEKDALISSINTKANKSLKVQKANGVETTLGQLDENDLIADKTFIIEVFDAIALVVNAMVETVNQLEASQNIWDITSQAPTVNTASDRKWETPFTDIGLKQGATQAEITAFANLLISKQIGYVKGYIEATLSGSQVDISTDELKIWPDLASAVWGTTNVQVRQNGTTISLRERVYIDTTNAKLIVETQPASGQSWQTTNPLLKQLRFNRSTAPIDTSSFAKIDLTNIDNAILKAKAILAGLISKEQLDAMFSNNSNKLIVNDDSDTPGIAEIGTGYKGVQSYGLQAQSTLQIGSSAKGNINIGSSATGNIFMGFGSTGSLEIGSNSALVAGRKRVLLSNNKEANFDAIIGVVNSLTGSTITFEDGTTLVL